MRTPLKLGTYDDAGMICDADGVELFSVGQNEDTRTLTAAQQALADEVLYKLNHYSLLADGNEQAWKVAKSLQAQVTLLENGLAEMCLVAERTFAQLQQHRES